MNEKHPGKAIYRRVSCSGKNGLKLTGTALNMLLEIDGKVDLNQIAARSGLAAAEVQAAIANLLEQGLVEPVQIADPIVPAAAFSKIQACIVKAVGPVGDFLLDEKVEDLGHSIEKFPIHLLPELVETIAREIQRPDNSLAFKRQMIELIKTLNR
jgi:DNA-binding Lrp family transcriptional regulator